MPVAWGIPPWPDLKKYFYHIDSATSRRNLGEGDILPLRYRVFPDETLIVAQHIGPVGHLCGGGNCPGSVSPVNTLAHQIWRVRPLGSLGRGLVTMAVVAGAFIPDLSLFVMGGV